MSSYVYRGYNHDVIFATATKFKSGESNLQFYLKKNYRKSKIAFYILGLETYSVVLISVKHANLSMLKS